MDANFSFYVKFIANYALTFFGYIVSVLAMVLCFVLSIGSKRFWTVQIVLGEYKIVSKNAKIITFKLEVSFAQNTNMYIFNTCYAQGKIPSSKG